MCYFNSYANIEAVIVSCNEIIRITNWLSFSFCNTLFIVIGDNFILIQHGFAMGFMPSISGLAFNKLQVYCTHKWSCGVCSCIRKFHTCFYVSSSTY